jgi:peptidoglycan hydrolase-like protein with peptidoglycan-binding domain
MYVLHKVRSRFSLILLLSVIVLGASLGLRAASSARTVEAASWPTEKQGSTDENVASIQLLLLAHGYSLSVDGSFGPQTASTVKTFQSDHGLGVDGVVGPQTWSALIITTSQGSTGYAVEALQRQLNANGENVSVDSDFGPLTDQAVRDFQSSRGLSVDGSAGPQTWNALVNRLPPVTTSSWPNLAQGSSGEDVYSIQLLLQARGYSLSIDGDFGPQTAAAVKSFQSAHGLGVDGQVGPQTWPALIITTSQGSSGSAVTALQRQLNTHGQNLATDGDFGPLTTSAVRSYQSSHQLGVDGIAGPQTWQSLVSTSGTTSPPPPPPPPSGSTLWGFDTTDVITSSYLSKVTSTRGHPDFIGRYIDAISWSPMGASEASYIHSQGIPIMVLDSSVTSNDTTYSTGVWMANRVISKAHTLGIPAGVAIFSDIENTSPVDAPFIEGWYDTISASGYKPGYYVNPRSGSSQFSSAFCTAIGTNANIANQSILWSDEPSMGWTTKANAPAFAPALPYCNGRAVGNMLAWQYALTGGGFNIDSDEINASVPLW